MKTSFWKSLLSDPHTKDWSIKRVIAFIVTIVLCIDLFMCSQKVAINPPASLISALEFIVITCIAGSAAEKFAPLRAAIGNISKTETKIEQSTTEINPKTEGHEG